jgi:hypothetical protein
MWYNDAEQYVLWVIIIACGWFSVLKLNKAKPHWRAITPAATRTEAANQDARFSNLALTAMKSTKLAALLVMNPRPVRSVSCFFKLARQSGGCRAHCADKQGNPPRGHPGNQPSAGGV